MDPHLVVLPAALGAAARRPLRRAVVGLLIVMTAFGSLPVAMAGPRAVHPEAGQAGQFSPIVWLATDERIYPVMPHAFAFDGIDNDDDGLVDLEDSDEIRLAGDAHGDLLKSEYEPAINRLAPLQIIFHQEEQDDPDTLVLQAVAQEKAQMALQPSDLAPGPLRPNLRRSLEARGVSVSEQASIEERAGRPVVVNPLRILELEPGKSSAESPIPLQPSVLSALRSRGLVVDSSSVQSNPRGGDDFRVHGDTEHLYWITVEGEGKQRHNVVYDRSNQVFDIISRPGESQVLLDRVSRWPRPRVGYAIDSEKVQNKRVIQYWFYYWYDIGAGAHLHDGEYAFVFVDTMSFEVAGVVGGAHSGASANNVLVQGGRRRQFETLRPDCLPRHMPILVELGKHASAPDRNFDGRFDVGMDTNHLFADSWGVRDVPAAHGMNTLRRVETWLSFPRDHSSVLGERSWYAQYRELAHADSMYGGDSPASERGLESINPGDLANMRRFTDPPSKFRLDYPTYALYPIADMRYLVDTLLADPNTGLAEVTGFLTDHKDCFWDGKAPTTVVLGPQQLEAMREWARAKTSKRDMWTHEDFKDPSLVFKPWLAPRVALVTGMLLEGGHAVGQLSLAVADVKIGSHRYFPHSTFEPFVTYDFEVEDLKDIGVLWNVYRASHSGFYLGVARGGGTMEPGHGVLMAGYVPAIWDTQSLSFLRWLPGRPRIALRVGLRAEFSPFSDSGAQLDPIQPQGSLQLSWAMLHERHPLEP